MGGSVGAGPGEGGGSGAVGATPEGAAAEVGGGGSRGTKLGESAKVCGGGTGIMSTVSARFPASTSAFGRPP
jgi:hypothetical protein